MTELPPVPQVTTVPALVTALNDRIRRINLAFGSSSSTTQTKDAAYGTHAQRVGRPIPDDATLYVETDRNEVAYQVQGTVWQYVSGIYRRTDGQLAALALTLASADTGLLVFTTDTLLLYRWSGTALVRQDGYQPTLADTHGNRLASYPSVRYAVGQEFWETDRTLRYIAQNAAGTVTVTLGTTVTWVSGHHFINTGTGFTAAQWPAGTVIVIDGVSCTVAAVASPTVLTLQSATTNAVGVVYSVGSGRWEYAMGRTVKAWASMPTDLGENDIAASGGGLEFFDNVNSLHIWQWSGSAWTWGPGNRASGEMAEFDADPGTGWHLCDGTGSLTKYAADGTRSAVFTVPDRRNFYTKGGTYTGTGAAAIAPTIANTQPMSTSSETPGPILALTPAIYDVTVPSVTAIQAASVNPAITHGHTLPTITLNADGKPATFATLYYYRL